MRFLLLAMIATLSLTFSSCNRGPGPDAPTEVAKEKKSNTNLTKIENFGEEAVSRISKKVDLTEEQKVSIHNISADFDFAGTDVAGRKGMVQQMMKRIKGEVLTKEQLSKGGY